MARPVEENENPITLFPFLSILACVIGTLILMITALALSQMNTPADDEAVQRAQAYVVLKNRQGEDQKQLTVLRQDVERAQPLYDEIARLKKERTRLTTRQQESTTVKDPAAELDRLKREMENLAQRLQDSAEDSAKGQKLLALLKRELARRREVPTESVLKVQPGGSGRMLSMKPVFVEATQLGLVLHDRKPTKFVGKAQIKSDPAFQDTLKRVVKDPKGIVIFLVREDGINAYNQARQLADSRQTRNGKLPLVGQGELDLSRFKRN